MRTDTVSVSRRKFLGLFGAAVATPYIPPIKEEVGEIFELSYQENGMYQYYAGYPTFSDVITNTLRTHKYQLYENVRNNNSLMEKFRGKAEKA